MQNGIQKKKKSMIFRIKNKTAVSLDNNSLFIFLEILKKDG
jgi:hypothetical protein